MSKRFVAAVVEDQFSTPEEYAVAKERAQQYVPSEGEPTMSALVVDDTAQTLTYTLTNVG
jgi:hypothetical protein